MANEAVASGGGSGGGEEVGTPSGGSSPRNRMKFLCSYGGKIMPRPADGQLKYVGGETRVIGVPRDTNFSELMRKLKSEFEGDMILKYQVIPDELDVLVSVRTEEDLKHMLDEYDRHENGGTVKLRAFLFPSSPVMLENQNGLTDPHSTEQQRYIDAINNTVRTISSLRPAPIIANRPSFSISASSSPKGNSPEDNGIHEPTFMNSYKSSRFPMHKVHSSPSLYNLGALQHQSNNHGNHHYYQPHHHHQQLHQKHHPHSYQSPSRIPHEPPHRLSPSLSLGRPDFGRSPFSHLSSQYHSNVHNAGSSNVHNNNNNGSSSGHSFLSGNSNKHGGYYDEQQHSVYGCRSNERLDGSSLSPKSRLLEHSMR